jgi:DNA repair exonuclease SbcCD ATPase subunit
MGMFEDINREMEELKEKLWERKKLSNRREQLRANITTQNKRLYDLEYEMNKEKADVEELKTLNVSTLIYKLLGSKDKKLKKEQEEYIRAKLKYDEANNLLEALKKEEDSISSKLLELRDIEEQYEELSLIKEKMILEGTTTLKEKFLELEISINNVKDDIREYSEAISAGMTLLYELKKLTDSLNSASNWGIVDMLGGGLLSTAVKHGHLDDAKEITYRLNKLSANFKRELIDIKLDASIEVNLSSFESFGDYFFDGVFVDWMVQGKIDTSLENVVNLHRHLEVILSDLENKKKTLDSKLSSLIYERNTLIEKA